MEKIIEELYKNARDILQNDPITAAQFLSETAATITQSDNSFDSVISSLFFAEVYKRAKSSLFNKLGIEYNDNPYTDHDNLEEYCINQGIVLSKKLKELDNDMNALCPKFLTAKLEKPITNLTHIIYDYIKENELWGRKIIFKFKDKEKTATIEAKFDGPIDEAKIVNETSLDLDLLLKYFIAERKWIAKFEESSKYLDLKKNDPRLRPMNNSGALIYDAKDAFKEVVGDLVFIPLSHTRDYKLLSDFYQSIMPNGTISSPIAVTENNNAQFNILRYETLDLEAYLVDNNISKYDRFCALARNLCIHIELEQKLYPHIIKNDTDVGLKIKYYGGFFKIALVIPETAHDYSKELFSSMIAGRINEKARLAKSDECHVINERLEYIRGTNPDIDRLISEFKQFKDHLEISELSFLKCATDVDSQPSNYFINGKINDLDKVEYASSIYMAARLLAHPTTLSFLKSLSKDEEAIFLGRFTEESKNQIIGNAIQTVEDFGFDKNLLGLYSAIKLDNSGKEKKEYSDLFNLMKHTFDAHAGWISAFHVMSHECRQNDSNTAKEYLKTSLQYLSKKEFISFKDAYVEALKNSSHAHLLTE